MKTIYSLSTPVRDTVIIKDTIERKVKSFDYTSKWVDVDGLLDGDSLKLNIRNREELTIVESVEYKRFLGFLWKTSKVKRRDVDVVSKNPHTEIVDVDYVSIVD